MCDIAPLEVFDVLLGQRYMWKHHVVYESRPCSVIITLGKRLYMIPEVAPKASISLISSIQCRKVIAKMEKFVLFMVHSQSEKKIVTTSTTSAQSPATQKKQVDHGRIQGHIHLNYRGTTALPSQAFN